MAGALRELAQLDGVLQVTVEDGAELSIRYDAGRIGYGEIESALDKAGLRRRRTWGWRLRGIWYRYVDDNIRANARARGGACCSRPPPGAGGDGG